MHLSLFGEDASAKVKKFVITKFGARPDSTMLQTAAIQKTIDAAAVQGGIVVIH